MKKSYDRKKILCFGEVLWDILPEGRKIGGAPLNVAYHLNKLGIEAILVSRIGKDDLGSDIQEFMKENDLAGSILQADTLHPTSTVEAKIGADHEVTYQILEDVAWDFIEYDNALRQLVEEVDYLVYGSLIARGSLSRNTLYNLLESPLIKVMDVNLRTPFYSKEILQILLAKADIVKMNEAELHIISEWFDYPGSEEDKMKTLAQAFELKVLIATHGSKGAYVWYDNHLLFEPGYRVQVADTVGSGDAFLAGFLSEYIMGDPPSVAFKTANKMGAFIAQKNGGCPHYTIAEVQAILNSDIRSL